MRTLQDKIEALLEDKPTTRNSDILLYLELCKRINPVVTGLSFETVVSNLYEFGLPNPESVRRCRQKLQHDKSGLRANEATTEKRYERFKEVLDYVTE